MRVLPVILLVLGCGGGGGGGGGSNGGTPTDPLQATALEILRDCVSDQLDDDLEILAAFRDILDPGAGGAPRLQFTQVVGTSASWTLDVDGDNTNDFAGSVRFTDAAGNPVTPFDLSLLLSNTQRLVTRFVGIAAGTRVVIQVASAGVGNKNAQFTAVLGTGVVSTMSAGITSTANPCSVTISFADVSFTSLGGVVPNAVFNISVQSNDGLVVGTISFNGGNIAALAVRLNGVSDLYGFTLNLGSGSVSTN